DPDHLAHAVRLAEEAGADIAKTAYSGDAASFERVASATSLPVLMAGGDPQTNQETVENVRGAMDAGATGVSIGRTVFQHNDPEAVTRAVVAVVHDDASVEEALACAEL